jgi:hypothetical protein
MLLVVVVALAVSGAAAVALAGASDGHTPPVVRGGHRRALRAVPPGGSPSRRGRVASPSGAVELPRLDAAGPPPLGAAGPPPIGAAGPPPLGAAGPPPIGAAAPTVDTLPQE